MTSLEFPGSASKSALKRTTNAATLIGHMEVATTVNEVGQSFQSSAQDTLSPQPTRKKQFIGDKEKERKWIRSNLKMKICASYKENPKQKDSCMCGRRKQKEHTPEARVNICEGKWSVDSEDCVVTFPTTAYGEIEFPNANIAKFVRVADDTDMDEIMYLLTDIWGLLKPNLLISVTGGAKNITMSKKLKDAFKKGLLKTAQTTGAWILSGGNNDGVMKYVGEAVNMLQSSRKVVAFGIAPWGCVANKRELSSAEGVWPAYYPLRDEVSKGAKNANLDPNHTHFILVDNGTFRKFGTEIDFRGLMEKTISHMMTDADIASATNVPVVSIVVEGGPGTLTTVRAAIDNATPVVVLDGSGRAADMLAYAYNNTEEEDVTTYDKNGKSIQEKVPRIPDEVQKKLRSMVADEWPNKDTDELVETIIHCVMRRHLIVIFSLDDKNTMKDIDIAILHAIMKANKNDAMNQLKLALAWNRIDVVKEEIFTDDKSWDAKELEDILLTALVQNKVDFVELLMDHIHLGTFATKKRMLELYNDVPKNHVLYRMLMTIKDKEQRTVSLANVGEVIKLLVGDFFNPLYLRDERYNALNSDRILGREKKRPGTLKRGVTKIFRRDTTTRGFDSSDSDDDEKDMAAIATDDGAVFSIKALDKAKNKSQIVPTEMSQSKKKVYEFDWPARELFIWSVLMRRKDLAMLFLNEEKYAIAPALSAAIMLRNMTNQSYTIDAEVVCEIENMAKEFENIAIGVLGECFATDELKSKTLLIRVIPSYGEATLLQLAVEADNKEFVSHQACQSLLNNIWYGKLDELQGEWRLIVSVICLPLMYAVVQFRNEEELQERHKMKLKRKRKKRKRLEKVEHHMDKTIDERFAKPVSAVDPEAIDLDEDEELKELTCWKKLTSFFNAPKITFLINTIFYAAFLTFFTYMMISEFHPENVHEYSWVEIIVSVWVIALFVEELRQFVVVESNNLFTKVTTYFSDVWNIVDLGTILLYTAGYTIRIIDHRYLISQAVARKEQELLADGIEAYDSWRYAEEDIDTQVAGRQSYARVLLSLSLLAFWCRILHIFFIIRILGPKLVMIGRMIKDLLSFGVILAVFTMAFGIAQHAIMYPNERPDFWVLFNVLRRPYWQMYGELFLEDLEGEELNTCISNCTEDKYCFQLRDYLSERATPRTCRNGSAPIDNLGACADGSDYGCYSSYPVPEGLPTYAFPNDKVVFCYDNRSGYDDAPSCNFDLDRCPETNRVVPVMLGFYILFTQILMFNLLIAMFSYTFTLVQENTDIHWKFQRYATIKEYYTRPPIPPPFIILNHLGLLIRHIYRKCKTDQTFVGDDFKELLDDVTEKQLAVWERINFEDFSRKQQVIVEETMEFQVSSSKADLNMLMTNSEAMSNLPNLYDRMNFVETRLNDTGEALNWIMKALSSSKMGQGQPPLLKIVEDDVTRQEVLDAEEKLFNELKAKKNGFVHVKCRSSPYRKASRIRRFPVPNSKVYWEIVWSGYQPVRYTSDEILSGKADYADLDIFKMSAAEAQNRFRFNEQDGAICRISFHGKYQIDKNMLPLNPFGRTGLTGRGDLGRWGPNHALDGIVSRWKRFEDGDYELRNNKKVLEFIGMKRADVDEWALPGLMSDQKPEDREGMALQAIKQKALEECMTEECIAALESISSPKMIYEGYCDDPRNTDNAWVETLAYNFHDEDGSITKNLKLKPKVGWIEATSDLILFAGHSLIVKKLIAEHKAAE